MVLATLTIKYSQFWSWHTTSVLFHLYYCFLLSFLSCPSAPLLALPCSTYTGIGDLSWGIDHLPEIYQMIYVIRVHSSNVREYELRSWQAIRECPDMHVANIGAIGWNRARNGVSSIFQLCETAFFLKKGQDDFRISRAMMEYALWQLHERVGA